MNIEQICFTNPIFDRRFDYNVEELSGMELAARAVQKVNEMVIALNTGLNTIAGKEDSVNITNNRLLSPSGNFTGWLQGRSVTQVLTDISNSLSLVNTLIDMVNNRESIGTIYDGGNFTDTIPPTITIDGSAF